jgi:hypothetical protein
MAAGLLTPALARPRLRSSASPRSAACERRCRNAVGRRMGRAEIMPHHNRLSLLAASNWLSFFLLALRWRAFPGQSSAAPLRNSLEPIGAAADQNRDEERDNLPPRDLDQEPHDLHR